MRNRTCGPGRNETIWHLLRSAHSLSFQFPTHQFLVILWPFPGSSYFTPQSSNVLGMDCTPTILKRTPQRNLSLLWQTHYNASDENSALFRWGDHHPTVTISLSSLERSPCPPCVLFLTLWVHILCLVCLSCCYYVMFLFFVFFPLDSPSLVGLAPFFSHPQHRQPRLWELW